MTTLNAGTRWRSWVRRQIEPALGLNDAPDRTAAAFAVGVFFGFSPFLGLQTIAAFICAYLFRLNRLAVFCGLNMNLPWILVPWYAGTTWLAAQAIRVSPEADLYTRLESLFGASIWESRFWQLLIEVSGPWLLPFLMGPTVSAAVVALITFRASRVCLRVTAGAEVGE